MKSVTVSKQSIDGDPFEAESILSLNDSRQDQQEVIFKGAKFQTDQQIMEERKDLYRILDSNLMIVTPQNKGFLEESLSLGLP